MTALLLEIWGGACYLLNKVGFSRAERGMTPEGQRAWRIRSWIVYLAGLPAWVTVFCIEHNWIAAAVESGGAPAMVCGLVIALKGRGKEPRWLDRLAMGSVVLGLVLSCWDYGGIRTLNQILELLIAAGFLLGTYLTARQRLDGYYWLMLGNVTCAALMGRQGYVILAIQQLVSLGFVIDAWCARKRKRH